MPISPLKSTTTTKRPSITNVSDDDDERGCGRGRVGAREDRHRRRISSVGSEKGRVVSEAERRGKRLITVASQLVSDSESDLDCISTCTDLSSSSEGNKQLHVLLKRAAGHRRPGLRSSLSRKELKTYDECSSQSSVLTDEDGGEVSLKKDTEGIIPAVHTGKKDKHLLSKDAGDELYEAMGTELLHTVNEIRLDLLHAMGKSETSALGNNNYIQLKSGKHKPDLLAEMMLEKRHGGELSKAVTSLLPDSMLAEEESGIRKADDRKILTEEADIIIEDFISNVEDTDISLIDGEKSDASSSLGGFARQGTFYDPTLLDSRPAEIDGIVLPWLQWETCDDDSVSCDKKKEPSFNTRNITNDARQDQISAEEDISICCTRSGGSWIPAVEFSSNIGESRVNKSTKTSSVVQSSLGGSRRAQIDVDKYHNLRSDEDFLCERWRQKQMISTGALLLCNYRYF